MIYELKRYTPHVGKADALRERILHVTLPIFERLGMRVQTEAQSQDPSSNLSYVVAPLNEEERAAAWLAFGNDAQWRQTKAESETDGPLLDVQTTTLIAFNRAATALQIVKTCLPHLTQASRGMSIKMALPAMG